jgi:hypothetical protein
MRGIQYAVTPARNEMAAFTGYSLSRMIQLWLLTAHWPRPTSRLTTIYARPVLQILQRII